MVYYTIDLSENGGTYENVPYYKKLLKHLDITRSLLDSFRKEYPIRNDIVTILFRYTDYLNHGKVPFNEIQKSWSNHYAPRGRSDGSLEITRGYILNSLVDLETNLEIQMESFKKRYKSNDETCRMFLIEAMSGETIYGSTLVYYNPKNRLGLPNHDGLFMEYFIKFPIPFITSVLFKGLQKGQKSLNRVLLTQVEELTRKLGLKTIFINFSDLGTLQGKVFQKYGFKAYNESSVSLPCFGKSDPYDVVYYMDVTVTSNTSSPLDKYQLAEEIGRGSHSIVYRGINRETGKEVAVKQISYFSLGKGGKNKYHEESIKREIANYKMLKGNDIVPQLIEYFNADSHGESYTYLILELIPGDNMETTMRQNSTWDYMWSSILKIVKIIYRFHESGWVHNRLGLSKIMIDGDKLHIVGIAHAMNFNEAIKNANSAATTLAIAIRDINTDYAKALNFGDIDTQDFTGSELDRERISKLKQWRINNFPSSYRLPGKYVEALVTTYKNLDRSNIQELVNMNYSI